MYLLAAASVNFVPVFNNGFKAVLIGAVIILPIALPRGANTKAD
nr:MAG: hypothetical protein [Bacteriophage sp.]UVX47258.1 MAG: hypothetical protein [Bacteriophage sp.]